MTPVASSKFNLGTKVLYKDVTGTITTSGGAVQTISTGITDTNILAVFPIYNNDYYYIVGELDRFEYAISNGNIAIRISGTMTQNRTLTFRVAYRA